MTLIERLEAATAGSRELDGDIALYVGAVPSIYTRRGADDAGARGLFFAEKVEPPRYWEAPRYTTSLDAALTLVPEGWLWDVGNYSTYAYVTLTLTGEGFLSARGDTEVSANAKTAPLALCIASLRARTP